MNKKVMSKMQMIFQDPVDSLDPRMTVEDIIQEGLHIQGQYNAFENSQKVREALIKVGLLPEYASRYPHEFSGGQRQRIGIARALASSPEFIMCDEPVSALDVSIQGQILNLLQDLRAKKNLSFVFITHDLKVAGWFCDRIAVMYRGAIVEEAPAATLFQNARHPYTKLLFDGAQGKAQASSVEVTSVLSKENGCPFAHRCPYAKAECSAALPLLREVADGHRVRCVME